MAGVSAAEARVKPVLLGKFGLLPSSAATPLALVLAELLQNALQHGLRRADRNWPRAWAGNSRTS